MSKAMDFLFGPNPMFYPVQQWLYGDYDETKYKTFTALYSVPGVHQFFDYLLDSRSDQEYFDRYGMTYSDIHDPRKLRSNGSGSYLLRTSVDLGILYGDDKKRKKR